MLSQVGIFFGAVVRGDLNKIRIGGTTAVLDRAVVHAARWVKCTQIVYEPVTGGTVKSAFLLPTLCIACVRACRDVITGLNPATLIGEFVTIEPYCVLRSCRIESKVILGARTVVSREDRLVC